VIPDAFFESARIQTILETIVTPGFKARVEALGGYSLEKTGTVVEITGE